MRTTKRFLKSASPIVRHKRKYKSGSCESYSTHTKASSLDTLVLLYTFIWVHLLTGHYRARFVWPAPA